MSALLRAEHSLYKGEKYEWYCFKKGGIFLCSLVYHSLLQGYEFHFHYNINPKLIFSAMFEFMNNVLK